MNVLGLEGDPCEPSQSPKKPKEEGSIVPKDGLPPSWTAPSQANLLGSLRWASSLPPSAEVAMGTPQHRQALGIA